MADRDPGKNHFGAFKRGWKQALRVLEGERKPYRNEQKDTWDAIGYRHGLRHEVLDQDAMDAAWEWSVAERQRVEVVDTSAYNP